MRRAVAFVFVLILVGALAAPLTTARPSWFCERRPTHPSCAPATPTPSPTPTASPSPSPTPTPTPAPTPTPSPTPTPAPCPSSLQPLIDAAPSGGTVDLRGCTLPGPASIGKPLTLRNGTITGQTTDRWASLISISSDDVTVSDITFRGGGQVISVFGRNRVTIARNTFTDQIGSAISLWGEGRGSSLVTISDNRITQTATSGVSPIMGRGSESAEPCSVANDRVAITGNVIDQGAGSLGWFGVELKCHTDTLIEGNTFTGGRALVSLPDNATAMVRGNTFNLTGSAYWGVEVAHSRDVTVTGNTFYGDGPGGTDHAVSLNSNSYNTKVTINTARDIRTLVDLGGDLTTITDNCLTNVLRVTEFESSGTNTIVERNGACP